MRTYKVKGMTCGGCEKAVTRAIQRQLGDDTPVEADACRGEVRVTPSADPQIVTFAIEGAGYRVDDLPSKWWTPLIRSGRARKVSDGEDETGVHT